MILFKLRRLMNQRGFSHSALQGLTEIRGGTLTDLMNNRNKMLPVSALEEICRVMNINIDNLIKYIPKEKEFVYWRRYVDMYKSSQFGNYDWNNDEDFEDFRAANDALLNKGELFVGRRKEMKLDELLAENGLRLAPDGNLLEYDAPELHPNDSNYNREIRKNVLDKLPSFFDGPDTLEKKRLLLQQYWINSELSLRDDIDKLIPLNTRLFLMHIEKRRRLMNIDK